MKATVTHLHALNSSRIASVCGISSERILVFTLTGENGECVLMCNTRANIPNKKDPTTLMGRYIIVGAINSSPVNPMAPGHALGGGMPIQNEETKNPMTKEIGREYFFNLLPDASLSAVILLRTVSARTAIRNPTPSHGKIVIEGNLVENAP
jgi:hypothetical protein